MAAIESSPDLAQLQKKLGIKFTNLDLLKEALTHRSYLNEHPDWPFSHNERLEFLGDAVLELAVTEELFLRFPQKPEGELTPIRAALVNYINLSAVSRDIGLESFLLLSRGEQQGSSRAKTIILANAFESVLGAVYLDRGYKTAKKFINAFVMATLDEILKKQLYRDDKSLLQEIVQAKYKVTPTYKILSESGPEHKKFFTSGVYMIGTLLASGSGYSKQEAEDKAAKAALKTLRQEANS